jgi:hypothetical protein
VTLETKGPPRRGSAAGPKGVCLRAGTFIDPKTVPPQELSPDFWPAKGVEAQKWYVGISIGFKKVAHGEASHKVLERFVRDRRLLIKSAFWRGDKQDAVLSRLLDLFLDEEVGH